VLASGIDLPVVKKILGHSQISTTQVYAKVLEEQVHKQMKKFKLDL
jgi:site-specific recombinase XerD